METLNETPFAVGGLFTRSSAGEASLTVIVKGTFTLAQGQTAVIAAEQRPLCGDQYMGQDAGRVCRYEDDFAPYKPRADLLLASQGPAHDGEPAVAAFQVGQHKASLSNYGPLPRTAGERATLAGPNGGDWFTSHWPRLNADCAWDYFNAAPTDLRVDGYLAGNEGLAIECESRTQPEVHARLPGLRVRSFLKGHDDTVAEIQMNLDTLWVDLAGRSLVLVWRGRTAAKPSDLEDAGQLLVVSEPLNQTQPAATHEARLREGAAQEAPAEEAPEVSDLAPEMDATMTEAGLEPAALPEELRAFLKDPGIGADGLAAISGLAGPESDTGNEAAGAATFTAELAASGIAVDDAPAPFSDPAKAAEHPDFAEQAGLDEPQVAALTAQEDQGRAELPSEIKAFADNPAAGDSGLIELLRSDESPITQELAAEALKQAPPAEPPSAEDLAKAMESVPYWPPQNADEAAAIETLTASFGAGRPPDGDGAGFLIVLDDLAGEPREAGGPGADHVG